MSERHLGWATLLAFAARQQRGQRGRTALAILAPLLAVLGVALAGTVTTSATLVALHDLARRPAALYDLLVRPRGAVTAVERRLGLVAPDELRWGTGITLAQWSAIARLPGVAVAAPVAPGGTLRLAAPWPRRVAVAGIDPASEARLLPLGRALTAGALLPAALAPRELLTPPLLLLTAAGRAPHATTTAALLQTLNGATVGGGLSPPALDGYRLLGTSALHTPALARQSATVLPALPGTAAAWLTIGRPAGAVVGVLDAARLLLGDQGLDPLPFAVYGRGTQAALPELLTDVRALCRLLGDGCISALRVRVRAPAGINSRRAALVAQVAQAIESRTGLRVDVTYGAAARPVQVEDHGRAQTELWTAPGAALAISRGVNAVNLLLLGLVCAVAAISIVASSLVAALQRGREREILRHHGWSRRELRALALADVALVGAAIALPALAALAGVALALGPGALSPVTWAALPLGLGLYLLGATVGSSQWSVGSRQLAVVRRHRHGSGVRPPATDNWLLPTAYYLLPWWLVLALRDQWRRPLRAVLAALAAGVTAGVFALLLLGLGALHGLLSLTLLGQSVALELAPYHLALAAIAVCLALAGLADLAAQNVRERRAELGTLRALGCAPRLVLRLVAVEAGLPSIPGALLGVLATTLLMMRSYGAALDATLVVPDALRAGAAAMFLGLAAMLPPAILATRISPVEAQRDD